MTQGLPCTQVPTLTPFEALVALGETDPWWAPGTRLAPGNGTGSQARASSAAARPCRAADLPSAAVDAEAQQSSGSAAGRAAGSEPTATCAGASAADRTSAARQEAAGDERRTRTDGGFDPYPMDYYARDSGVWGSSYHKRSGQQPRREPLRRDVAMPV